MLERLKVVESTLTYFFYLQRRYTETCFFSYRGGMIQTWEQYQFVHQVLSRYARVLAGENVHTPSTSSSCHQPDFYGRRHSPDNVINTSSDVCKPTTPKQRRSFSITDLPAAKGLKNENEVDDVFGGSVVPSPHHSPPKFGGDSRAGSRSRLSLKRSSPSSTPPAAAMADEDGTPAVQSRFTRLCLQPVNLNNLQGETPPSSGGSGDTPSNNANNKTSRFSFSDTKMTAESTTTSSPPVSADAKENSPLPSTPIPRNAFEFPTLTNGHSPPATGSPMLDDQTTDNASSFTTFVFPVSEGGR